MEITNAQYYYLLYHRYNRREPFNNFEIGNLQILIPNEFVIRVDFKIEFDYNNRKICIIKAEDDWFFVSMLFDRHYTFYQCDQFEELIACIQNIGIE